MSGMIYQVAMNDNQIRIALKALNCYKEEYARKEEEIEEIDWLVEWLEDFIRPETEDK